MNRYLLLCFLFIACFGTPSGFAQPVPMNDAPQMESPSDTTILRVGPLTIDLGPPLFFLFGAFCALWAQNTGRNCWLWFFLGLFFSVVTIFFLLTKNANDIQRREIRERIGARDEVQQ